MKTLPKGSLKAIHINRKAIAENELRARAAVEPRRLVPPITVWTTVEGQTVKIEGFAISKAKMQVNYDVTRFPLGYKLGTPDVRVWLETTEALAIAETYGEQPPSSALV